MGKPPSHAGILPAALPAFSAPIGVSWLLPNSLAVTRLLAANKPKVKQALVSCLNLFITLPFGDEF